MVRWNELFFYSSELWVFCSHDIYCRTAVYWSSILVQLAGCLVCNINISFNLFPELDPTDKEYNIAINNANIANSNRLPVSWVLVYLPVTTCNLLCIHDDVKYNLFLTIRTRYMFGPFSHWKIWNLEVEDNYEVFIMKMLCLNIVIFRNSKMTEFVKGGLLSDTKLAHTIYNVLQW